MHQHLARFTGTEGVLFIGRAQEKALLFRTEKRRDAEGNSYPWIVKTTGVVNHFYVYAVDADFGPFFLKFCSYFPYNARLCINGHEWAKRQAVKAGIAFTALTTVLPLWRTRARCKPSAIGWDPPRFRACWTSGWRSCPVRSPRLTTTRVTATNCRSCRGEFSLIQMLDRPVSGRMFFEHTQNTQIASFAVRSQHQSEPCRRASASASWCASRLSCRGRLPFTTGVQQSADAVPLLRGERRERVDDGPNGDCCIEGRCRPACA
jgi:hypothetical protein